LKAFVKPPDDPVLERVDALHVHAGQGRANAERLAVPGGICDLGGVQQRLRGHAPAVQTGATEAVTLDQRD
jgi:hypothetical protein